ncbi:uncharacterized protein LOC106770345 [Vigna radiata var. radiata]|uniref:Uncharacterized protein LOC106770345 n=1 Tax=Vigna radiata var. radiata TaxID=3916 RepID=A0A3Q0F8X1_VIGRR|nr:uncharacterized protein LOC106770345 [Vigna radiata var. radiata]
MDTLSSSVSSLKVTPFPSSPTITNHDFFPFKATPSRPQQPHHVFSTSAPTSLPKTKSFSHKSSPSLVRFSSSVCNSNPATGYAAALVDVAHNTHSFHSVHRDVERLLKLLQSVKFESPAVDFQRRKDMWHPLLASYMDSPFAT